MKILFDLRDHPDHGLVRVANEQLAAADDGYCFVIDDLGVQGLPEPRYRGYADAANALRRAGAA